MAIVASKKNTSLIRAILELSEYLDEDPIATAFNVGNSFFCAAERWHQQKPQAPEELVEYYQTTTALLHQLVFANYGIPHELELIQRASELFPADATVLDLGAGIGSFLLQIDCKERVHADVGGELLAYATWRYHRADAKNVRVCQLPLDYVENNPFGNEQFDGVICTEVLEHVPDPRALVGFLSKVVKPGGTLLATVSFEDKDGMIPQHLNTDVWTNERFIAEVFPARGFELIEEDVYRKVR